MRLPDFVVIGAMKAGTTSLYHYLRQHPAVFMPSPKEVDFFYKQKAWKRGTAWYASLFEAAGGAQVAGEASPNYTKTHLVPQVPARMAEVLPDARLVYCLRDPVERIRSHHIHVLAERAADRASKRGGVRRAAEALLGPVRRERRSSFVLNEHFVLTSSYARQIERFLQCFTREQLLLVTAEELRSDRVGTMAEIYGFIGVDPDFVPAEEVEHHASADKFPGAERFRLDERTVEALRERLAPDVRRLRRYMGPGFDGWGIA